MKDKNKLNMFDRNKVKIKKAIISIISTILIFGFLIMMTLNKSFTKAFVLVFLLILLFVLLCVMIYLVIGGFDDER